MRQNVIVSVFLLVLLLGAAAPGMSQEDMVVVDNSVFTHPVRSASLFEHDVHNDQAELDDCAVCHHLYEDGQLLEDESSEDQQCVACHSEKSGDGGVSLRRAYHMRCKGCHLVEKAGPVMCAECHVKH